MSRLMEYVNAAQYTLQGCPPLVLCDAVDIDAVETTLCTMLQNVVSDAVYYYRTFVQIAHRLYTKCETSKILQHGKHHLPTLRELAADSPDGRCEYTASSLNKLHSILTDLATDFLVGCNLHMNLMFPAPLLWRAGSTRVQEQWRRVLAVTSELSDDTRDAYGTMPTPFLCEFLECNKALMQVDKGSSDDQNNQLKFMTENKISECYSNVDTQMMIVAAFFLAPHVVLIQPQSAAFCAAIPLTTTRQTAVISSIEYALLHGMSDLCNDTLRKLTPLDAVSLMCNLIAHSNYGGLLWMPVIYQCLLHLQKKDARPVDVAERHLDFMERRVSECRLPMHELRGKLTLSPRLVTTVGLETPPVSSIPNVTSSETPNKKRKIGK